MLQEKNMNKKKNTEQNICNSAPKVFVSKVFYGHTTHSISHFMIPADKARCESSSSLRLKCFTGNEQDMLRYLQRCSDGRT